MLRSAFIALFVATAYAQSPTDSEYLHLYAAPSILLTIADCESGDGTVGSAKQFNADGSVLTNATGDFGIFQINKIHIKEAKSMGFDVMTLKGNIQYALYLYSKNGTWDWRFSKKCWGDKSPPLNS